MIDCKFAPVVRQVICRDLSPKRMDGRECVLRSLAFSFFPPGSYTSDNCDQFLNAAMAHGDTISVNGPDAMTDVIGRAGSASRTQGACTLSGDGG